MQQEVYAVEGTGSGGKDGLFAKERHYSDGLHYKRMGGAADWGHFHYLYPGTERQGMWLLGDSTSSFKAREALYRAPAGEGGAVPKRGWMWNSSCRCKDGGEVERDRPDIRVTGFRLKKTAAGVFQEGVGETDEGVLCRTGRGKYKSELWSHTLWSDQAFCSKIKKCEFESEKQQAVVITGTNARNGIYTRITLGLYLQKGGDSVLVKAGNSWAIAECSSSNQYKYEYKSGESHEVPQEGWQRVAEDGSESPFPDLRVTGAPANFTGNQIETGEELICRLRVTKEWYHLPRGEELRCNGVCDCESCSDEEECEDTEFKGTGFLVVRGLNLEQNGVYELVDEPDKAPFFRHTKAKEKLIIARKSGPSGVLFLTFNGTSSAGMDAPLCRENRLPRPAPHSRKKSRPARPPPSG